jgi:hypothetical protein
MKTYKSNAVIIGFLFIFTMLIGMIDAYLVVPAFKHPIVSILQMDTTILVGVFSVLIIAVGIVFIAINFFPVLKRYNETIAIAYLALRTIECVFLLVGCICYLYIIALGKSCIHDATISTYSSGITLALSIKYYAFQLAMLVLSFGSIFLCYALYKARLVPPFLSIWGGIGYLFLLSSAVLEICGLVDTTQGVGALLYVPGGLWEIIVFPIWLFRKGFNIVVPSNH